MSETEQDNGYLLSTPSWRRYDYAIHKLVRGDAPGDVPNYSTNYDAAKALLDYVRGKGNKSIDLIMMEYLVHHNTDKFTERDMAQGICDCILESVGLSMPKPAEV